MRGSKPPGPASIAEALSQIRWKERTELLRRREQTTARSRDEVVEEVAYRAGDQATYCGEHSPESAKPRADVQRGVGSDEQLAALRSDDHAVGKVQPILGRNPAQERIALKRG